MVNELKCCQRMYAGIEAAASAICHLLKDSPRRKIHSSSSGATIYAVSNMWVVEPKPFAVSGLPANFVRDSGLIP